MVAAFGLGEPHHDTVVPTHALVESNPVVDVFELDRRGLVHGDQIQIEPPAVPGGHLAALRAPGKSGTEPQTVRVRWHEKPGIVAARIAFVCPEEDCSRLCYRLHFTNGAWRCRKCANGGAGLVYSSRSRNRTVRGLARALWLRKRLGASQQLFSPIAPRPRHHRKYWRLAAELRQIERGIAIYLGVINDVLERRSARRSRARERRHPL